MSNKVCGVAARHRTWLSGICCGYQSCRPASVQSHLYTSSCWMPSTYSLWWHVMACYSEVLRGLLTDAFERCQQHSNDDDNVRMLVRMLLKSSNAMRLSPRSHASNIVDGVRRLRPPSIAVNVISLNTTNIVCGDGLKNLALLDFSIAFSLMPSTVVDGVSENANEMVVARIECCQRCSMVCDRCWSRLTAVDSVSLNTTEIYQC